MKKLKFFNLILCVILLMSLLPIGNAFASSTSISKNRLPIKCYNLNRRLYTYTDAALKNYTGYIDPGDEIWVQTINGSSAFGSYPIAGGKRKSAWFSLAGILQNTGYSEKIYTAAGTITTYKRSSGSETYGYISKGDTIYQLSDIVNSRVQVLYTISNSVYDKIAWIPASSFTSAKPNISTTAMRATTKARATTYKCGSQVVWDTVVSGGTMPYKLEYQVRNAKGNTIATGFNSWCNDTGFGFGWNTGNTQAGIYYLFVKITDTFGRTTNCTSGWVTLQSSYNADAAVRFARDNAYTKLPGEPSQGCAFFVSACLDKGGYKLPNTNYPDAKGRNYNIRTWAPSMYSYLVAQKGTTINPIASQVKAGDIVFYKYKASDTCPDHVEIITGKDNRGVPITCSHNYAKRDQPWGTGVWKVIRMS